MYKESTTIHSACRSLLQKSVRRGDSLLTDKLIQHLNDAGEASWLKKRAGVIIFEECWPLANDLTNIHAFQQLLKVATFTRKKKDAAGLGSLGFALSKGDASVLGYDPRDKHIRIIAEASRPWEGFSFET